MGSEISISNSKNQTPEVKQLADNMTLQSNYAEAAEMKSDKRLRMHAQDFYCPLVSGGYERRTEQFFQCKAALTSEVFEANGLVPRTAESVHDDDGGVVSDSTSSQDCKAGGVGIPETKDEAEADNAGLPTTDQHVQDAILNNANVKSEEISSDYERGTEQFFQCKSALTSEVPEANGLAPSTTESVHDDDGVAVSDSTSSQDCKVGDAGIQETKDEAEADNAGPPTTSHPVQDEIVNDINVKSEEISGDYERGTTQFSQCISALTSVVLEANGVVPTTAESVHDDDGVGVGDSTSSQDCKDEIEADNAVLPTTGHLVEVEIMNDANVKTEEVIVAGETPPKPNLDCFLVEHVKIPPPPPPVLTCDSCTNTSQPLFADIAVGNSQPEMMEACTAMSQKDVSTIDCGIQTSQELLFQAVEQPVPSNITTVQNEEPSTSASKKFPIVFPRVRCQTSGPEVPAKRPRLSELDQRRVSLIPIYSSSVTFDFNGEESDKENDRSILRQRGNVRNLMKESTYLYPSPSKTEEPDVENDENVPSQAHSSGSGSTSRGPFLRVGLSKKLRIPRPLHPRTFEWE